MACCPFAVFIIGQIYGWWATLMGQGDAAQPANPVVGWQPGLDQVRPRRSARRYLVTAFATSALGLAVTVTVGPADAIRNADHHPGRGVGAQPLGLARLRPLGLYEVDGRPELSFQAGPDGAARLVVDLKDRTALHIRPGG